jgi:hypothetical protein
LTEQNENLKAMAEEKEALEHKKTELEQKNELNIEYLHQRTNQIEEMKTQLQKSMEKKLQESVERKKLEIELAE